MNDTILFGPLSIDRYVDPDPARHIDLPGGGALNMAYHWSRTGRSFRLLSRIGDDRRSLFDAFLRRHDIGALPGLVVPGTTASIDITVRADLQPWMDHFVEGVWADVHLTADDERAIRRSGHLHGVLVDAVADELERLAREGLLDDVATSVDLLDARHITDERLTRTLQYAGLAFIGWPGETDAPFLDRVRHEASRRHRLVVVTLGARGVLLLDARDGTLHERLVPITPVEVRGTTIGCGDAFIAAFLHRWWTDAGLDEAVSAGAAAGAAATAWRRPLPDDAYD